MISIYTVAERNNILCGHGWIKESFQYLHVDASQEYGDPFDSMNLLCNCRGKSRGGGLNLVVDL